MPERSEMLGGTQGAQFADFFRSMIDRIIEIGLSAGLDWSTMQREFDENLPERIDPRIVRNLWIGQVRSAIIEAIQAYRRAPPLPPSRVKRDYYDPTIKLAASLSAHLQGEYGNSLLASAFQSHDDALAFVDMLERISAISSIDETAAHHRRVESICAEYGIALQDPIEHIRKNFGESAVALYKKVEGDFRELEKKRRRDPIRFRLACDVISAVSAPLGIAMNIMNGENVPIRALTEIVTEVVEAVGTFPGTPKPDEDYFAKDLTAAAIEFCAAQTLLDEVASRFDI